MTPILRRRSIRALTRGGTRSWLIVLTLSVAVIGVWLLAIPMVVDSTMAHAVEADRLYHVRLHPNAVALSEADLATLRDTPNVTAVEARLVASGQVVFEGLRVDVGLVGVEDFSAQQVDIVEIEDGQAPALDGVVVDTENLRHARLQADVGAPLLVVGPDGTQRRMAVTGTGGSLHFSSGVREGDPILYLTDATMKELTGWPGFTSIELLVDQRDPAAVEATIAAVEQAIDRLSPTMTYWRSPVVWEPGDWPAKDGFDNFRSLFVILASVAVVSGLFVVFNTVNMMVRRDAREIGTIKALGGQRRHVARAYVETAILMGAIATVAGSIAGVLLANLLVSAVGSSLMAVTPEFGVPLPVVGIAAIVGIGGTTLSALPGVLWATRLPVRDALARHGIGSAVKRGRIDRFLERIRFVSRPAQIGLRSAARSRGRSTATGLQIGIAVGVALAFISLGATMLHLVDRSFDAEAGDIHVYDQGGRALDGSTLGLIEATAGVALAQPIHYAGLDYDGDTYDAWGLPAETIYEYDLLEGRWFREGETGVVVVGQALAAEQDVEIGDRITVDRFDGRLEVEVIGIDRVMVDDGKAFFVPLAPWLEAAGRTGPNAYWIQTTSPDPEVVDATAGRIDQMLRDRGHSVRTERRYVERAATRSEATLILTFIVLLGVPVLGIGMIALVNTITISTIERTKEIGVLRSLGARRKHIRKMLRAEGLAIAALGWLIGIPLGFGVARLLVWMISRAFEATFPVIFPLWSVLPVLVLTLLVAAFVIRFPLRRTLRMSPGEALRYE